jgi:hypothetical protein
MHSIEYFLLESSLEGFGVSQSSLLSTYVHTVSSTEMFCTITIPSLPRMLTQYFSYAYFLSIPFAVASRPPPSFSSGGGESKGLTIGSNRSSILPLASSSSLITTCNPPCRHLYPTHVSSLYSSNPYGTEYQRTWM